MIYLDAEDLADIAAAVLEPDPVVIRDVGLLSMAAHRPRTEVFGHEPYPTIAQKAAALLVSVCQNHPLQDGNKRLALAAGWVFCGLNCGRQPALTQDEAYELVMGVARGELDVPEVATALREAGIPDA
ncbi:death-on-curing protein [Krasilnikovia cinnamomea]|uniref:Death-on-curing protein n=1 Tax=Krasilnikovia cinnamomea TaxID=349313 RepID=A0A4Q7ZIK5_9ACTN|nr:type II toxin-antitoxin system death-on-curing family toxin [Krasilnikovia cinnamomea]RZU49949.1 death-on-curing protein [Krasilnikovia cinnamomea]